MCTPSVVGLSALGLQQPGRILTAYAIYTPSDGSSLQAAGATPILALYADIVAGIQVRLKPYSIESQEGLRETMNHIWERLESWEVNP